MRLLVVLGGLWAAWNGVVFVLNSEMRHRAESAWFIFGAILLFAGLALRRRIVPTAFQSPEEPSASRMWAVTIGVSLVVMALVLYSPIFGIGLLSDDFVLLQRARQGALIDSSWDYVRPLPLALWWALDYALPTHLVPSALHVLNAGLHGVNAWLVYRLGRALGLQQRGAAMAAALFLTWPSNVEPVAWASGLFDILLTVSVLSSTVILLSYRLQAASTIGLVSVMTMAALASKETAVALPLLLALLIPFARAERRQTALISLGASAILVLLYGLGRIVWGLPESQMVPLSGYALKEMLSRPFGSLGLGLHARIINSVPLVGIGLALLWPAILIRSARAWREEPKTFHLVALGVLWVLCSVFPLFTMLYVGPDLQGSRYLYLGSTVWSIAVVSMVMRHCAGAGDRSGPAILIGLVAVFAAVVLAHQRPWMEASETRERVLSGLTSLPGDCVPTDVRGLPDHVAGAYVFRNGFPEALAQTGRPKDSPAPQDSPALPCVVQWDGSQFAVSR